MLSWTPFPFTSAYVYDPGCVAQHWQRLHAGDAEPMPGDDAVLQAWAHFHNGAFQSAFESGLGLGPAGVTVANKACCVYANYLEPSEKSRLALFLETAERARMQATIDPLNPAAWYWQAYALGRYSQGISVAKALAEGLGQRIRAALEETLRLQPLHADAHVALGAFHAEVIDKVGAMIGGVTYGAKKDEGMKLFRKALELNPDSAIARIEYANAMVMLDGKKAMKEAEVRYAEAAACEPKDAMERLDVELAKSEIE